jgi:hemoglobin/transferrin/lactoferrin receptor protein
MTYEPWSAVRCAVIAALGLGAGTTGALAADSSTPAEIETVTVYARRLVPVTQVAATVTVISRDAIDRTMASDVRDLVRYEPGLAVRNDPFRFGLDTFPVRGIGGNRVAVEVDSIPSSGGFAVRSFADSGRSFIDQHSSSAWKYCVVRRRRSMAATPSVAS